MVLDGSAPGLAAPAAHCAALPSRTIALAALPSARLAPPHTMIGAAGRRLTPPGTPCLEPPAFPSRAASNPARTGRQPAQDSNPRAFSSLACASPRASPTLGRRASNRRPPSPIERASPRMRLGRGSGGLEPPPPPAQGPPRPNPQRSNLALFYPHARRVLCAGARRGPRWRAWARSGRDAMLPQHVGCGGRHGSTLLCALGPRFSSDRVVFALCLHD